VTPDPDSPQISALAFEILDYLVEHPKAQDTMEGIMQWWLLEQQIKRWGAQVQTALADLTAEELLLERRGKDGRIHYQINRRKLGEIRTLLSQREKRETTIAKGSDGRRRSETET
jgi:hypothetical protein